jgi:hypothetical protein
MPQILHKNKWFNVKDIEKCDDGYAYQVDGIDGKVYSRDVKDVRLSKEETHEIVNPDGSITRGPGKEPLRKPLKKSLLDRWKLLKAEISHKNAFLDAVDEDEQPQGEEPPQDETPQGEEPQGEEPQQGEQSKIEDPDAQDQSDAISPEALQGSGDSASADDADGAETDQQMDEEGGAYDEEKLVDMLRQEGYSDSEIAYVIHGHVPGSQNPEAKAMDIENQREQEKHDHHMDRVKNQSDIQTDHAKRMADLEYEHAKHEKALRIKHLEEELKTKLEHLKNKGKADGKAD